MFRGVLSFLVINSTALSMKVYVDKQVKELDVIRAFRES